MSMVHECVSRRAFCCSPSSAAAAYTGLLGMKMPGPGGTDTSAVIRAFVAIVVSAVVCAERQVGGARSKHGTHSSSQVSSLIREGARAALQQTCTHGSVPSCSPVRVRLSRTVFRRSQIFTSPSVLAVATSLGRAEGPQSCPASLADQGTATPRTRTACACIMKKGREVNE